MNENDPYLPSETLMRGFIVAGESLEDAQALARTALLALIAGGFVLGTRDALPSQPLHLPGENSWNN